ncbi:DHA2 family efflux MFS transporter permease subunit [Modestobacter excelsi]|uniref:DHA2 family efflux MFS transporter permease subunit n=1 Tax=Modestobacter excelsi TaxID=2213161 RepID=UPI001C20CD7B|nr:DHA2 family efflux MFS transporter permease subunit [Modestobacter excelsi]
MNVHPGRRHRPGTLTGKDRARASAPADTNPSALVALRSHDGALLVATTVLASLVAFYDAAVVTVAVPAISGDLAAGVSGVQWVVTGYLLTGAALLLLSGALIDHFGRRRVLAAGLLVMLVASVLCAIAPTTAALVAARLVQGAGAAMVVPSSLALLNGTLTTADRARGIGVWAGLATLGMAVGPYAGGWLADHASWRYVFLLNLPLVAVTLAMLRRLPGLARPGRPLSLDVGGAALAVAGLGGLIYALTAGPSAGWLSPPVLSSAVVGMVCLAALVPVESHQRSPMLRLSLFRSRQFDAINTATLLLYGALAAAAYLVVLQVQLTLGYSAAAAGAVLVPESAVFLVLSPFAGGLVARVGPRRLMVLGMLAIAAAFGRLSAVGAGDHYAGAVLPGALLEGLGLGLTVAPLTASVLATVDDEDLGEAAAVNDAASRVGGVLLVALVPVLIGVGDQDLGDALAGGYRSAMLVMAGLAAAAAVVTGVFVSDHLATVPKVLPSPRVHGCAVPAEGPVPDRAGAGMARE